MSVDHKGFEIKESKGTEVCVCAVSGMMIKEAHL